MDTIEEIGIEVDGGYGEYGQEVRAFLTIGGDFVNTFEKYLRQEDAATITLRIHRQDAEALHAQLSKILYG